jgi:hypothetical protein
MARDVEAALDRFTSAPLHLQILVSGEGALVYADAENRYGPFDATRLVRDRTTGAFAVISDSGRGFVSLVRALAAMRAEDGPEEGLVEALLDVLLLPLGLEYAPAETTTAASSPTVSSTELPFGVVPTQDAVIRQLAAYGIELPYSYVFPADEELNRDALREALARFPVSGVREDLEVPSPFDQAVAAARSEAGLEFFPQDTLTPVVRVWAASAPALHGLLDALARYRSWARRSPNVLDQLRGQGAEWILSGVLDDLGFSWV